MTEAPVVRRCRHCGEAIKPTGNTWIHLPLEGTTVGHFVRCRKQDDGWTTTRYAQPEEDSPMTGPRLLTLELTEDEAEMLLDELRRRSGVLRFLAQMRHTTPVEQDEYLRVARVLDRIHLRLVQEDIHR